ncbi:MAG: protein kinase, partial [Solirubrobacteraceae bacterium]
MRAALFRRHEPIRIGRFTLLERLGAGAMGDIYAAYDDQLDRKVALKLVRSGFVRKGDERLLREAQTLAQVSHPN